MYPEIQREGEKEAFIKLESKVQGFEKNYREKMKAFSDKRYAHFEIMEEDKAKEYREKIQVTWSEFKKMLEEAKDILSEILLFWDNSCTDFAESQYADFKRRFWSLISLAGQ